MTNNIKLGQGRAVPQALEPHRHRGRAGGAHEIVEHGPGLTGGIGVLGEGIALHCRNVL